MKTLVPADSASPFLTRAERSLLDYLRSAGKAAPQTIQEFIQGKLRFEPKSYYVRAHINAASGKQTYLDETVDKVVGLSNFHQGYLPKFVNFAIEKIRMSYATHASITDPQAINSYSGVVSDWPAALRNAEFLLTQNRNTLLEVPANLMGTSEDSDRAIGDADGYELDTPIILEENKLVEFEVDYAQGQSILDADEYFLEIQLIGVQVRLRG